jgi:hypothetical protein
MTQIPQMTETQLMALTISTWQSYNRATDDYCNLNATIDARIREEAPAEEISEWEALSSSFKEKYAEWKTKWFDTLNLLRVHGYTPAEFL